MHRETQIKKQQIGGQLDQEIDRLYSIGSENKQFYTGADKLLFRIQVKDLKQKSDYQKGTWINAARKVITRNKQRVARDKEIRQMREYLRPGSTTQMLRRRGQIIGQWENNLRIPEGTRRGPTNQEE